MNSDLQKTILSAVLRHLLSAVGAWLLTKGLVSADQVTVITGWTDGLVGGVMLMGAIGWSVIRTRFLKKPTPLVIIQNPLPPKPVQ